METQCCKKKGKKVGGRGCNVKTRAAWQGFHHGDAPVHTGCTHTHASTNTEQNRIKRKTVTGLKHTTTPQWRDYQTGHKDALKQTDNLPKLGMFSRCNTERSGFAGLGESVCTQKAILGREGSHLTTEDEGDGKGRFKRLTATTNTITRHSQEKKNTQRDKKRRKPRHGDFFVYFSCLVLSRTRTYALTEVATTKTPPLVEPPGRTRAKMATLR